MKSKKWKSLLAGMLAAALAVANLPAGAGTVYAGEEGTEEQVTADVKITVTGADDLTYDGKAKNPTIKVTLSDGTELTENTDYTLNYSNSGSEGENDLTSAGTVTVTATVTSGAGITSDNPITAKETFTINPKPITITAKNKTITYGDELEDGTGDDVTVGEGELVSGHKIKSVKWKELTDTNVTTGGAITPNSVVIVDSNNDDKEVTSNYQIEYESGTLTIEKADPTVGTVTCSTEKIYTSTNLEDIELTDSGDDSTPGKLELKGDTVLTVGENTYTWVFTPTDSNYKTATGTISLTVLEDTLSSITISTAPSKTAYKYGETFDPTGMVVTATYDSENTKDVTNDIKIIYENGGESFQMGETTVTISYTEGDVTKTADQTMTINKADAPTLAFNPTSSSHKAGNTGTKTATLTGLPEDAGETSYTASVTTDTSGILENNVTMKDGTLTYTLTGKGEAGNTATITVTVTMANYESKTVELTVILANKDTLILAVADITVEYNGEAVKASAMDAKATCDGTAVAGTWSWKKESGPTNVSDSGSWVIVFTPSDIESYDSAETSVNVTINKATPSGTPGYTKITQSGKTLKDAALTVGSITPAAGTIQWVSSEGKALAEDTTVTAGTEYQWLFTPTDDKNYDTLSGKLTPYVSGSGSGSGGSGSGGSGSGSGSSSNSSGSDSSSSDSSANTTTETKSDGTVVETTVQTTENGSVTTVKETTADGTVTVTETVVADGTNNRGKATETTTVTQTDGSGAVTSVTETTVIPASSAATSTTVTVKKDADGDITSAKATITRTVSSGNKAAVSGGIVEQILEAAKTDDVNVTMVVKDKNGNTKYKLKVNTGDLEAGNDLYIYRYNTKTGEYTMVNAKTYTVSDSGSVTVSMTKKAVFKLVDSKEAKKINKEIKAAITPKKSSATVKAGKKTTFALSSGANKENIKSITYTTGNKSVATVSKSGKVKAKNKGTVTVKAKVTLKNGQTKTIKMKIKVK